MIVFFEVVFEFLIKLVVNVLGVLFKIMFDMGKEYNVLVVVFVGVKEYVIV